LLPLKADKESKFKIRDKIFAHLETWRLYTVIWSGLVSLAGACIAYGELPPIRIAALALFIPMMGWTAGLYVSDFLDRKLDAIQKPHRPIPSGRIRPYEALVVGAIFAFTGFILSFFLTLYNILLVFVVAFLVFAYAKISKSRGISGNINRGLVTVAAYFFGVFSADKPITLYIWLLSLVFLIHDTNSNLVGATRDMEGDKKGGYITIPVKYGVKKSLIIAFVLTVTYYSLIIILLFFYNFITYPYRFYAMFLLAICIICTMYITMFKSIRKIDRKKALQAHEFFVAERITLASAFIFGMVGSLYNSTLIYVIAITITLGTQYLIRKRYEFKEKT